MVYMAAQDGEAGVVEGLIQSGYPPDQAVGGRSPLFIAANNGHIDVVRALLLVLPAGGVDAADPHGTTPLAAAAEEGHEAVVAQLLAADANPSLADGDGDTALGLAVANGHGGVAELLRAASWSLGL